MLLARRGRLAMLTAIVVALALIPAKTIAAATTQPAPPVDYVRDCPADPPPGHYTCYSLHPKVITPKTAAQRQGLLGPADLQAAYNLPSASSQVGVGRTVFVIDAYGYQNAESDLIAYRTKYGLSPCTVSNGCFRKVNQDGLSADYLPENAGWAGESALDLDMVSAVCPNCHITLVEANTNGDDLFQAVRWAATHGAKYISMSWGSPEDPTNRSGPAYDAAYFSTKGIAYVASSGDDGFNAGPSYPASSPNVVSVGGTSLVADASPRHWTESAWGGAGNGGTGSGCSSSEPKPSWQHIISAGICARRAQNDISAVADVETPVDVIFNGLSDPSGGTSVSAPIITSIYALAGIPAANNPGSYPYANTGALYDVLSGNNGTCAPSLLCNAASGWDGPTGLGTPNGVAAFVSPVSVSSPGAQQSAVGNAVQLQIPIIASPSDTLTVTATGLPAGLSISPSGVVTGSPTTPGVSTVTATVKRGPVVLGSTTFTWTVGWAGTFIPVGPSRLLDTRSGVGAAKAKLAAGGSVPLQILGLAGIPMSGVSSVVLNVTATQTAAPGFVTAYADGAVRPATSNLNYVTGDTVPNLVVAPVGADGKVRLYTSAATHLVADVSGYYLKGTPVVPAGFAALQPSRLLDTRAGNGAPLRPVASGETVHLAVAGRGGVSAATNVSAVVLNVTATGSRAAGWVTAYPDGAGKPNASVLNFPAGRTVPNLVIVPVGADGKVNLTVTGGAGTDLLADVFGYYTTPGPPPTPGTFSALTPLRVLDTRTGFGSGGLVHVPAGTALAVHVPVIGASAVALNVTVTNATDGGAVTAYAGGSGRPGTSNLNFVAGQTVANLVIVPVSPSGVVNLYVSGPPSTAIDLIADLSGYYVLGLT